MIEGDIVQEKKETGRVVYLEGESNSDKESRTKKGKGWIKT